MAILIILISFIFVKLRPVVRKQQAFDIDRKATVRSLESGITQYIIDDLVLPPGTPVGDASSAKGICRESVTGGTCTGAPVNGVDLSDLVPTYLQMIPVDPSETDENITGYKLYSDGNDVYVIAVHLQTMPLPGGGSSGGGGSTLVAHWQLNDGNGTTALDSAGNNHNGTLVNGPTWSTGLSQGALQFDGANDEVTVADHASLDGFSAFTLSTWIHPYSWRDASIAGMQGAYEVRLRSDGKINFSVTRQTAISSSSVSVAPVGHWTHVTLAYDGSLARLYINGVLDNSVNATGTVAVASTPLRIGGGTFFHGKIDDVRLHSVALPATEIGALAVAGFPNSRVAYWALDDGAGTTASDSSGNGRTGNLINGPAWTATSTAPTTFSNAYSLQFDGSNDYVRVPYASGIDFKNGNGYSAATWAYLTPSMSQAGLIGMLTYPSQGWMLYGQGSYLYFFMNNGFSISTSIPSTGWHHIAGVWDGQQMRIYLDGILRNNAPYTLSPANGQSALLIGASYYSGNDHGGTPEYRFSGRLDELRLFNRPLSAAEISMLAAGSNLP